MGKGKHRPAPSWTEKPAPPVVPPSAPEPLVEPALAAPEAEEPSALDAPLPVEQAAPSVPGKLTCVVVHGIVRRNGTDHGPGAELVLHESEAARLLARGTVVTR